MSNKRAQGQSVVTTYIKERADVKKNQTLLQLLFSFVMKDLSWNLSCSSRKQQYKTWETGKEMKYWKMLLSLSSLENHGTHKWCVVVENGNEMLVGQWSGGAGKGCSTVQTQLCDMKPWHCVMECGSKAGLFVKSLEVLKCSCQKKKKVIYHGRAQGDSKGKTIQWVVQD